MTRLTQLAFAAVLALAAPAAAHEFSQGGLVIDHPYILLPEAGGTRAVGLLTIHNTSYETEQLTAVQGEGMTLMHHVEVGDEMRMVPVDRLAIPRATALMFSPDALHVVIDAPTEMAVGDTIEATFVFERAGAMDLTFIVEDPKEAHTDH